MTRRPLTLAVFGTLMFMTPLGGCGLHGRPAIARRAPEARASARATAAITQGGPPDLAAAAGGDEVVAPGIVEPRGAQVDLAASEPGRIAAIAVAEGDVVVAGQRLALLEDAPQRHALEVARAELAEAEAALVRLRRGATAEELRQARAAHEAAAAQSAFALAADARAVRLRRAQVLADSDAERADADARSRRAEADRAAARVRELERGARREDRDAAGARVVAARARLQLAEAALARRAVVAPRAGTILLSRFHAGEYYVPGATPFFVLGDLTQLQVRLEIDEIDAFAVPVGAACRVYSDGGERLVTGSITRLAPRIGRRALATEVPTARADVRVREAFVAVPARASLIPGQRVWGRVRRAVETQERR